MAHFAELDKNNIVLRVVVVDDKYEQEGIEWCENFFNGGTWIQTSYTGSIRKNYAGIGYSYSKVMDAFIPPKPFPSWVLDDATCRWDPPVPLPSDGKNYGWNESTQSWDEGII